MCNYQKILVTFTMWYIIYIASTQTNTKRDLQISLNVAETEQR